MSGQLAPPVSIRSAGATAMSASKVPWLGLGAVFLASVLVTLTSRLSSFALADVRGALGASVDEAAWITTAYSVGQMLVAPAAVWLARVVGTRKVLLGGASVFALAEFTQPFLNSVEWFTAMRLAAGMGSGTFVPVTIGFILQHVPRKYWPFGVGVYAMNVELSLNIAPTLEGWLIETASWKLIFWHSAALCVPLLALIHLGLPRVPVDKEEAKRGDFLGIALGSVSLSVLYAALDQGERLHWLDSPFIVAALIGGLVALAAFFVQQATTRGQSLDLTLLARENLLVVFALVLLLRILITAAGYLVPQYLVAVRGFRPLEVGDVLLWVAAPQLVISPLIALTLMRFDARGVMMAGIALTGLAFLLASRLTPSWAEADFVPSQLFQAVGQTASLTSLIYFSVQQFGPKDALTFGALIQTIRMMGGEIGVALVQFGTRVQEQQHSFWLWENVSLRQFQLDERLSSYAALLMKSSAESTATVQSLSLLDRALRAQAYTLACSDMFVFAFAGCLFALFLTTFLRR